MRGLVLGLGGQQAGGALRLEVQGAPQLAGDVERVQAQVVLRPALAEPVGEVAVAGPVDPLGPVGQLRDRGSPLVGGESAANVGRGYGLPRPARAFTARLPNIASPAIPPSIAR